MSGPRHDEFALFTDASYSYGLATGCTVVSGPGIATRYATQYYPSCDNAQVTEIYSAISAVLRSPRGRTGVLYVDLDMLWQPMRPATLRRLPSLQLFRTVLAGYPGIRVLRVNCTHSMYRCCHNYSRALARGLNRIARCEQLGHHDLRPRANRLITIVDKQAARVLSHARQNARR